MDKRVNLRPRRTGGTAVREKVVEAELEKAAAEAGGIAIKLTQPVGIPDRLIILPGGRCLFIEVKRPKGGRLSTIQRWWRDRLTALGCEWTLVSSPSSARLLTVDDLISDKASR